MNTFYEHHENSIRFGYRCFRSDPDQRADSTVPATGARGRVLQRVPPTVSGESTALLQRARCWTEEQTRRIRIGPPKLPSDDSAVHRVDGHDPRGRDLNCRAGRGPE